MANSVSDALDTQLWWTIALVASTAVLLARRGFVHYVEQGKSASEVFALRAHSLPYITVWAVIAIAAVVLAFFHDVAEAVGVTGVVFAEFVAVCLWQDYFENSDFVTQYVRENKHRLRYLLTHGLGMNVTEFEEFCRAVEVEVVEFWRRKLKNKKWNDLSDEELGTLMFTSGIESARVMTRALWEGVLFDVAAFMREWLAGIERVRIPSSLSGVMYEGGDADAQALFCMGIILANDTREVRNARAKDPTRNSGRQFSAARIARRKTAAEGILHWPNCLARVDDIKIQSIVWNTDNLSILKKGEKHPCSENRIPISVMYSLTEIIKAGYLRVSREGSIDASVTFKYSNMVFKKDEWNQLGTIERKPFRYITSATWMSGDPAFMVEQREITGGAAALDGSGFLEGVLNVKAAVVVKEEQDAWLERNAILDSNAGIWGNIHDFIQPRRPCFLNWPMLWAIQAAWTVLGWLSGLYQHFENLRKISIKTSMPTVFSQSTSRNRDTYERIVADERKRDPEGKTHRDESREIRSKYQSDHESRVSSIDPNSEAVPSSSRVSDPEQRV